MAERRIGLIMHGVTGRMGMNQHLIRSVAAIRREGGVPLANGDRLMPDPVIVGRNREKLESLARAHGIERVSTDLDACLADRRDEIFFDAATTQMRAALLRKAIAAGKHVYCEKPTADNLEDAMEVARLASGGHQGGVVQDKLFLPGLRKLKMVIDSGFLAASAREGRVRLLGVRGRPAADPAPELELQEGRGRRHHPRHALPLALRAGQPVRRGRGRLLPRRHAYPER
jgi:predicted dehydrogenase